MFTKFNHRPVQEFAYQRKPKIKVLTKLGFQELMKLQSNPVQFEEKEDMTLRIQININIKIQIHLLRNIDLKQLYKRNQNKQRMSRQGMLMNKYKNIMNLKI
ncbi:unnamed protein product [Paramecium sonneborni]|uniref:Uncharacterized protein n=1 Tax=Paramecium sonneborni TaxID=65129 RepID=A0A8S1QBH2_9CILI|nr:unnamed protein product [Paramecium sonneborni]